MAMRNSMVLCATVLFGSSAMASDLPKQGTDSFTNVWVATSNTIQQGNRTFLSYEIDGVARNDAGGPMFDRFGQRCLGWVETLANEGGSDRGTCTFTDHDGDNIFTTYSGKSDGKGVERGNYEVVGGTGKFTGITGTGDYFQPNIPIKADDKAFRGVVSNKISWKLP